MVEAVLLEMAGPDGAAVFDAADPRFDALAAGQRHPAFSSATAQTTRGSESTSTAKAGPSWPPAGL